LEPAECPKRGETHTVVGKAYTIRTVHYISICTEKRKDQYFNLLDQGLKGTLHITVLVRGKKRQHN